jgi:hypothetical protein
MLAKNIVDDMLTTKSSEAGEETTTGHAACRSNESEHDPI